MKKKKTNAAQEALSEEKAPAAQNNTDEKAPLKGASENASPSQENEKPAATAGDEAKPEKGGKRAAVLLYSGKLVRALCFFLILGILLSLTGYALMPKNNSQKKGMRNEHSVGFFSQPEGSIDVFFVGNSNTYGAFSPIEMWREYGIQTYTSGVGFERMTQTYTILKDLFKYHKPKAVVLETDGIFVSKKGADSFGTDFENLINAELPALRYHNRWKDVYLGEMLSEPNYTWHSYSHGQYVTAKSAPFRGVRTAKPSDVSEGIDPVTYFHMNRILSLCRENGADLMLVSAPTIKSWKYERHNAIQDFADKNGLKYVDLNLIEEELGIDWTKDTFDKGTHLNVYGAKKVSKYIGRVLAERYKLEDQRGNKELSAQWDKDYKQYRAQINRTKQQVTASG